MFRDAIPNFSTISCWIGRRALAQSRRTRSSVSSPLKVVRSMQVMARSIQAICQSFFTVRRVTRVAARRSTALVFTRTCSSQSRFSEVPRFGASGRPFNTAIAVELPPSAGTMRWPCLSVISSRGRSSAFILFLRVGSRPSVRQRLSISLRAPRFTLPTAATGLHFAANYSRIIPYGVFRAGRGPRQQLDIFLVEFLFVEVVLHFHEGFAHSRLASRRPCQRVSVTCAVIYVHIHVELLPLRDDGGVEPRNRRQFIPQIIGFGVFRHVLRGGRRALAYLLDQLFFHARLHGNVHRGEHDARPMRVQHGVRSFRVHPEIELAGRRH